MRNIPKMNIREQLEYLDDLFKYTIQVMVRDFNEITEFLDKIIKNKSLEVFENFKTYVDMEEEDNKLIIKVDFPNIKKEDIKINIKDDILSISAKSEKEDNISKSNGEYFESIILPEKAEAEKTSAEFKNGILIIEVPKVKEILGKKIIVK